MVIETLARSERRGALPGLNGAGESPAARAGKAE